MAATRTTTRRPRPVAPAMSETVVGKASPTVTATGPGSGTAGTAIAATNISSVPRRRHHHPGGEGHHHLHRLRPPEHRPDHVHHRGHDGGRRDHGQRQRHLPPLGRLHAGAAGDYWWYASYGGDTNNNTATSTCGAGMSETVGGQGLSDGDSERPRDRHRSGPQSRRAASALVRRRDHLSRR